VEHLDQQTFDHLLAWLDPDRDRAAERYELLRQRLILFFEGRSCGCAAEELADRTLDLVARKLALGAKIGVKLESYCYGVARYVRLEYSRLPTTVAILVEPPAEPSTTDEDHLALLSCIDACLQRLAPHERELIFRFYAGQGRDRIDDRKRMAEEAGISRNALGIRAYAIRCKLERSVRECLSAGRLETVSSFGPYTIDPKSANGQKRKS
jgi:hypothetical protein